MALFRRKQQDLTPEFQEYYQSGTEQRSGTTWVLAGLTLLVGALFVIGLFFGGRWLYRRVTNNDNNQGTTQQETAGNNTQNEQNQQGGGTNNGEATEPQPSPNPTPNPNPEPQPAPQPGPAPQPAPTPTPPTDIPRTGPEFDL